MTEAESALQADRRNAQKRLREKILIAVLSALMGIFGVWVGSVLSAKSARSAWSTAAEYEERSEVLRRRMEVLERAVSLFNKREKATFLELRSKTALDLNELDIQLKDVSAPFEARLQEVAASQGSLLDLSAEYAIVLTLASVYFGPSTKTAVELLNEQTDSGSWWEHDAGLQVLLDAMAEEMFYWPPLFDVPDAWREAG